MQKTLKFTRYDYKHGKSELVAYLYVEDQLLHRLSLWEGTTCIADVLEEQCKGELIGMLQAIGPVTVIAETRMDTLTSEEA